MATTSRPSATTTSLFQRGTNIMPQPQQCHPVVTGKHSSTNHDTLAHVCEHYHGAKGRFAYAAFAWANSSLYNESLPLPLIQWGLTAYGACIGQMSPRPDDLPVITLHPLIWRHGPRYTLDVVIHELTHVSTYYVKAGWGAGKSSHDNWTWAQEVMRISPLLGLSEFQAAPTKRKRMNHSMLRTTPEGCISMKALSRWPYSLRPEEYCSGWKILDQEPHAEETLPFGFPWGITP